MLSSHRLCPSHGAILSLSQMTSAWVRCATRQSDALMVVSLPAIGSAFSTRVRSHESSCPRVIWLTEIARNVKPVDSTEHRVIRGERMFTQ